MRPRERLAAALGLTLVLLVVIAAAGIRLETGIPGLRVVHRIAASLEVVVVLWLAWMAWRRRAVQVALGLTALLSVIGIIGGQQPPPAIAAANLLGGLALAALFAWIYGKSGSDPTRMNRGQTPIFALLLALQVALGAWLSIVELYSAALPAHGMLALVLSALLVWLARGKRLLVALALAAPLAGFSALHYEFSPLAALAHVVAAAALLVTAAYALARAA
ncbi:MAG TPA: hypothetical protein VF280_05705 [Burkholderiales bacterium]|jgi:heme A synthase